MNEKLGRDFKPITYRRNQNHLKTSLTTHNAAVESCRHPVAHVTSADDQAFVIGALPHWRPNFQKQNGLRSFQISIHCTLNYNEKKSVSESPTAANFRKMQSRRSIDASHLTSSPPY